MIEAEWFFTYNWPATLRHLLRYRDAPLISERQLRLFACALYRRHLLKNAGGGVSEVEAWADGGPEYRTSEGERDTDWHLTRGTALEAVRFYERADRRDPYEPCDADILRDIVGNPFRPVRLLTVEKKCPHCKGDGRRHIGGGFWDDCGFCKDGVVSTCPWLTWNDSTIPRLAQTMYEEYDFDRMSIMADALEEAGCTDEAILMHCRGKEKCTCGNRKTRTVFGRKYEHRICEGTGWVPRRGPHVRGCWVVDLLLRKEPS